MDKIKRLEDAFQYVRQTFFPRWDRKKEWFVEYLPPKFKKWHEEDLDRQIKRDGLEDRYPFKTKLGGICQDFRKCILIYTISKKDNALHLLLIHEICHAVSKDGHGEKWFEEMEKARGRALVINKGLAKLIELDICKERLSQKVYGAT